MSDPVKTDVLQGQRSCHIEGVEVFESLQQAYEAGVRPFPLPFQPQDQDQLSTKGEGEVSSSPRSITVTLVKAPGDVRVGDLVRAAAGYAQAMGLRLCALPETCSLANCVSRLPETPILIVSQDVTFAPILDQNLAWGMGVTAVHDDNPCGVEGIPDHYRLRGGDGQEISWLAFTDM
ncbi:hypothetical protein JXA59_02695 [Patescibacteria group bacterium]|nr:hypothetical protein [Patescibacteria group bacterium]